MPMAKLVPSQLNLESISGWTKLQDREQTVVRDQTRLLFETVYEAGKQRLKIGEHLYKVREVLKPHRGMFEAFLRKTTGSSRATAFRMIDDYLAAKTILPSPVMQVALMRPNQRLDAKMIKSSPPPKTTDITVINDYLDRVAKKTRAKQLQNAETDREVLLKQAFNSARNYCDKLSKGARKSFMKELSGMLLSYAGVEESVKPLEVPDGMVAVLGRPRIKQA